MTKAHRERRSQVIRVRVTPTLLVWLERVAVSTGKGQSQTVRDALATWLEACHPDRKPEMSYTLQAKRPAP